MDVFSPGATLPLSTSGNENSVIDEYLSDLALAGEVVATQSVQNAEVDQGEEAILSIETDICRGAVVCMKIAHSSGSSGFCGLKLALSLSHSSSQKRT